MSFMSGRPVLLSATVLVFAAAAGCVSPEAQPADAGDGHAHDHSAMADPWNLDLEGCVEGGFVAIYDGTFGGPSVQDPWVLADISDELGDPVFSSLVVPLTAPPTGHWHNAIQCDKATSDGKTYEDFEFGWVGVIVDPPAWDHGGADMHVLLAGFGLPDGEVRDALLEETTAAISTANRGQVNWLAPGAAVYAVYDDTPKGVYEVWGPVTELRDLGDRTVRWWWTVPADGSRSHSHGHEAVSDSVAAEGGFHPVWWDVTAEGGGTQWSTPESFSPGCHTGTDHHGPTGGACQPIMANLYERPSMSFTYGGVVEDVTIDVEWIH